MPTQYGDVAVTLANAVATVEIQRPPNNLLDIALLQSLATAFETFDHEPECRAIVLASAFPCRSRPGNENRWRTQILARLRQAEASRD